MQEQVEYAIRVTTPAIFYWRWDLKNIFFFL